MGHPVKHDKQCEWHEDSPMPHCRCAQRAYAANPIPGTPPSETTTPLAADRGVQALIASIAAHSTDRPHIEESGHTEETR